MKHVVSEYGLDANPLLKSSAQSILEELCLYRIGMARSKICCILSLRTRKEKVKKSWSTPRNVLSSTPSLHSPRQLVLHFHSNLPSRKGLVKKCELYSIMLAELFRYWDICAFVRGAESHAFDTSVPAKSPAHTLT